MLKGARNEGQQEGPGGQIALFYDFDINALSPTWQIVLWFKIFDDIKC